MLSYCFGNKTQASVVACYWSTLVSVISQCRRGAVSRSHRHSQPVREWSRISPFSCHSSASLQVLSQGVHYRWLSNEGKRRWSGLCTMQTGLFHWNQSDLVVEMLTKVSVSVLALLWQHLCPLILPCHASDTLWSSRLCKRVQFIHHL